MPTGAELIAQKTKEATLQAADGLIGVQVNKAVNGVVNGFLDMVFGKASQRDEMNKLHDRMLEIIDKSDLPGNQQRQGPPPFGITPREAVKQEFRDVNNLIHSSIESLEEASKKSRCVVCKETLKETASEVRERTKFVEDAVDKVLAIHQLKERGELNPDATWEELDKKEKSLVLGEIGRTNPNSPAINGMIDVVKRKPRKQSQKKKGTNKTGKSKKKKESGEYRTRAYKRRQAKFGN